MAAKCPPAFGVSALRGAALRPEVAVVAAECAPALIVGTWQMKERIFDDIALAFGMRGRLLRVVFVGLGIPPPAGSGWGELFAKHDNSLIQLNDTKVYFLLVKSKLTRHYCKKYVAARRPAALTTTFSEHFTTPKPRSGMLLTATIRPVMQLICLCQLRQSPASRLPSFSVEVVQARSRAGMRAVGLLRKQVVADGVLNQADH